MKLRKINPLEQENLLAQYKSTQEARAKLDKDLKEMKEELLKMKSGQYGDYILAFEMREVGSYRVPARTDKIIKVLKAVI